MKEDLGGDYVEKMLSKGRRLHHRAPGKELRLGPESPEWQGVSKRAGEWPR